MILSGPTDRGSHPLRKECWASGFSPGAIPTTLRAPLPSLGPDLAEADEVVADVRLVLEKFKYIDDTTLLQPVSLREAVRHITTSTTAEVLWPLALDGGLDGIARGDKEIGMRVIVNKTQLLCISPNNSCDTSAAINPDGNHWIQSCEVLKLVGFVFEASPGTSAHIDRIKDTFRRKVWSLFFLRDAGIKGQRLYKLYFEYIRSMMEYASPVFHYMLLKGQAEDLERLYRYALRV